MKKSLIYLWLNCMASTALANGFVLDNKTNYPGNNTAEKIAIQWVASTEATQKNNKLLLNDLDLSSILMLSKKGQIKLKPPLDVHYFRVLVWSTGKQEPDLLTNWVSIVPDKIYTLNQDYLIPAVLMSGAGC